MSANDPPIEVDVRVNGEQLVMPEDMQRIFEDRDETIRSATPVDYEPYDGDVSNYKQLNTPLGKVLFNIIKDITMLTKALKIKEMNTDCEETSLLLDQMAKRQRLTNMYQADQMFDTFETRLINKELNSHMTHDTTGPPTDFSPVKVLDNPRDRNEAMKTFPTRSPRFSGSTKDGSMDILEFITSMNMAQEVHRLSIPEFKQMLLLSTTGKAHVLIAEWIRLGEDIPTIYHNLILHFDKRITPEAAKEKLQNFKAPKNMTLREVETTLGSWVKRASDVYPVEGESRHNYYHMEAVQSLIRCLPPSSSALVQSTFHRLTARLGRAATFTELSRALNPDRHVIDLDIRNNGVDRNYNDKPFVKNNKFKKSSGQSGTKTQQVVYMMEAQSLPSPRVEHSNRFDQNNIVHVPGQDNGYPRNQGNKTNRYNNRSQSNGRTYFNNAGNMGNNNNRGQRNMNTKPMQYCSLCGKKDHLASQNCPYMVDAKGNIRKVMPTQSQCPLCPPFVKPRLNHPAVFCPYRKGGPLAKKN